MYEFVFVILLLLANAVLLIRPYGWINIIIGIFTLGISALTIGNSTIYPFQPYFSLLILTVAALTMYQGADSLRR